MVSPITTRSRVVLEVAAELVAMADQPLKQAKVLLRAQGEGPQDWPLRLFGSSTNEGVDAVVQRESVLAMINPSAVLTLAHRGLPPFTAPQPLCAVAVIPSLDQLIFAVHPGTGLTRLEEIAERRLPLRISIRGQRDHCLHFILEQVANAAGFSLRDIAAWGGSVQAEDSLPYPASRKFQRLAAGEIDAIFDEGATEWLDAGLAAGFRILPLADATIRTLEAGGYRRAVLSRERHPALAADVPTIDFSGWPIFVRADADDRIVTQICMALEARKALIPWEGEGPLPLHTMCRDTPATPLDVPLHPAAARFWQAQGYI